MKVASPPSLRVEPALCEAGESVLKPEEYRRSGVSCSVENVFGDLEQLAEARRRPGARFGIGARAS